MGSFVASSAWQRLIAMIAVGLATMWSVPGSERAGASVPIKGRENFSLVRPQHRLFLPKYETGRNVLSHSSSLAQQAVASPPAAVSSVDLSNDLQHGYSETAVAYDPFNTTRFLAGSNITNADEMPAFLSTDSGAHWTSSGTGASPTLFQSDPGIAMGDGFALYSFIGVDPNFNTTLYVSYGPAANMSGTSGTALTDPNTELPDKPLITIDTTSGKAHSHYENAYIGYDSFPTSNLMSNPIVVQTGVGSNYTEHEVWDSGGESGADPAVDPSTGTLYVAWLDFCGLTPTTLSQSCHSGNFKGQLLISKSTDGGLTWNSTNSNTPYRIADITTGAGSILPNYGGTCALGCAPRPVTSFPSVAIDSNGNLYAVWANGADAQAGTSTVPSANRMHIFFAKSIDGGSTWSPPTQLDTSNPNDAWQPAISVDPSTGNLTVVWYDRRDDTNNHLYRPYYTQSTNGGATWTTQIPISSDMSDPTIDCNGTGDYLQITSVGGHAHAVWTDMSETAPQIFSSDVDETGSFTLMSLPAETSSVRNPNGTTWSQMPGSAFDIGVGSDPSCTPAVVGTDNRAGGGGVYVWSTTPSPAPFQPPGKAWIGPVVGGSGTRITMDASGFPDTVNRSGGIYALSVNGSGQLNWLQLPGSATDIGSGADGSLWVIGTDAVPGGYGIYDFDFNSGSWASPGGGGVRLAIGPDGQPWIVNSADQIYCHNTSGWQHLPGAARDVGVGADGVAWVIGTNPVPGGYGVYRWSGTCAVAGAWVGVDGGAVAVSVGTDGLPFAINNAGEIYERLF